MVSLEKALKNLSIKERESVKETIQKLVKGNTKGLNIQKLTGYSDIFRVRKGNIRILYRSAGDKVFILKIARRSEKTYKHI